MTPVPATPPGELRPRILVVEDEFLIRCMISDELRDVGYGVIEACSADEAVELLTTGAPIDFLISDVRMPGRMNGLDLLKFVRRVSPDIPVLMMSAHLDPKDAMLDGATRFLAKPFAFSEVLDVVKSSLEKSLWPTSSLLRPLC